MRYFFLLFLAFGCSKNPVKVSSTDNPEISVQLLFEHEGCKVYRFVDEGYRYYTTCGGVEWDEVHCGGKCRRKVSNPTGHQ